MIPESVVKSIFENLMLIALVLSCADPFHPTEEEQKACAKYAGDKLSAILEEWSDNNGGQKIIILSDGEEEDED